MYTLRDYQEKAVSAGVEFFNDNKEKGGAIIIAPPAAGKSLLVASICKKLEGNTLVLQPSKELLEQNYSKAIAFGITDIGIFSASCGRKDIGKITFATIGSIIKKKDLFENFDRLIIDECHLANAKGGMYKEMIEYMGGKVLGLTATPFRQQAFSDFNTGQLRVVAKMLTRTRPRLFNKIIHITQIEDMYRSKFLCPVNYAVMQNYSQDEIPLNSTGMDFNQKALEEYNRGKSLVENCSNIISQNNYNSKHILVFMSSVSEANDLASRLNLMGIKSACVSAMTKKKDREQILEDFKSGKIKVATNVGTLTTGFDFPELDCAILSRPTQSLALYFQMIGRIIRLSQSKKLATLLDLCGNVQKFGKIEDFRFIEEKKGLHRLIGANNPLTGWDFLSKIDLEKTDYAGLKETEYQNDGGGMVHFGKYKGTHITKVPNDYLTWCAKNFDGPAKRMFQNEVDRRNLNDYKKDEQNNNSSPF